MVSDIHAMYAEKQRQYQDYLVESRVHEQKLNTALNALKTELSAMYEKLQGKEDDISIKLLELLNKYNNDEALQAESSIASFKLELQEISKILETQIREALA